MERLNVAVVGIGAMGKSHARVYSEMDDVNLVGICDVDKEAEKIAGRYDANYYDDCRELVEKEKLDAVSICVPTKLHKKVATDFIGKKINVLVEKPIATTIDEAREIIDEAKKNNVKLMVGHIERFNPVIVELKKRIENNELGRIYKVNCVRQSPFPQRIVDVGVIVDLAIHEIDILKYIIDSKISRVFAETAQRIHSKHEDLLIGTLRFANGILGVINANWLTPKKVREIAVTGEKGMFVANYLLQKLYFYENEFATKNFDYGNGYMGVTEGRASEIKIDKEEPLKIELNAFIDCVKNDAKVAVTGQDAMEALEIAEKFKQSSKENKVMML